MRDDVPAGRLILLCGLAFAGKSTVAEAIRTRLGAVVVSLDVINGRRGLFGGQGIPVAEWQRTHDLAAAETRAALETGAVVVVDDTSSLRFLRDRWRGLAAGAGVPFALVLVTIDAGTAVARRDRNRTDATRPDVVDEVFDEHVRAFEFPGAGERPLTVRSDDDLARWIDAHLGAPRRAGAG